MVGDRGVITNARRDEGKISTEAALDGIYVIRTSVDANRLDTVGVVGAYKNLAHIERDFRSIKSDDLDLRPVRHYLTDRVTAYIFLYARSLPYLAFAQSTRTTHVHRREHS